MAFSIKNILPQEPNTKNLIWWLLAFALFFYGIDQMISAGNSFYNHGISVAEHTVAFSGEGKAKAVPDTAKFEAGLITEGADSISVQSQNSEKMNKVISYLKSEGITDENIATSQYNLSPKYDYVKGRTVLSGYILNQTVTVIVHDINKLGKILDGTVTNGANQINSVSMFVDKPEDLKANARLDAIQQAREKAAATAAAAGFSLGRLVGFTENQQGVPPVYYETMGRGGAASAPAPQIEPGAQDIVVDVVLTYQIR